MGVARSESWSRSSASETKKRGWKRWFWLGLLSAAIVFALVAADIDRYPKEYMNPGPAEFAIVLGARSQNGEPLPVYRARIDYALQLYREGKVKKILFTGGANAPETLSQAEAAKHYALERGLPQSDIFTEAVSMRTLENFQEALKVLPNAYGTTVLIVSDPLHLKRAMLMAQDLGFQARPAPVPQTLLRSRWSRGKFLARETFAYIYYWVLRR